MGAALERALVEAEAREPGAHPVDVHRLAAVRGAGQRQLRLADGEALGGAALQQDQRLQGLDRRAREDRPIGLARGMAQRAGGIADRVADAVPALDMLATVDEDSDRNGLRSGNGHNKGLAARDKLGERGLRRTAAPAADAGAQRVWSDTAERGGNGGAGCTAARGSP